MGNEKTEETATKHEAAAVAVAEAGVSGGGGGGGGARERESHHPLAGREKSRMGSEKAEETATKHEAAAVAEAEAGVSGGGRGRGGARERESHHPLAGREKSRMGNEKAEETATKHEEAAAAAAAAAAAVAEAGVSGGGGGGGGARERERSVPKAALRDEGPSLMMLNLGNPERLDVLRFTFIPKGMKPYDRQILLDSGATLVAKIFVVAGSEVDNPSLIDSVMRNGPARYTYQNEREAFLLISYSQLLDSKVHNFLSLYETVTPIVIS